MYSDSETASKTAAGSDYCGDDPVVVDRDHCPRGLPVRILVCGHCDADNAEPRLVWGADGLACEMQLAAVAMAPPSTDSSGNEAGSASTSISTPPPERIVDTNNDVGVEERKSLSLSVSEGAEGSISGDWQELVEVSEAGWWQRCVSPGEEYLLFWEEEVLRALSSSMQAVLSQKIHDKLR